MIMDGYEYERKVLWPMWNKESEDQLARARSSSKVKAQNASALQNNNHIDSVTKERLKKELGLEIGNPMDSVFGVASTMLKNPDNFYPELSPNNEIWDLGRRFGDRRA